MSYRAWFERLEAVEHMVHKERCKCIVKKDIQENFGENTYRKYNRRMSSWNVCLGYVFL